MKNVTIEMIPLDQIEIHPTVKGTYRDKDCSYMKFSLKLYGQQNVIIVTKRKEKYLIVDGVDRYLLATTESDLNIESLECMVVHIPDEEILDHRIRYNQKTKPSIAETCIQVEHLLGILGSSQGKKREQLDLGNENLDADFELLGNDRFELTCKLLNLDFKSSTLRKLMSVYYYETDPNNTKKLGLLELIDKGDMNITKAYNKIATVKNKDEEQDEMVRLDHERKTIDVSYQLFSKSSIDLSDIPSNSVRLAIDSPAYWRILKYENQDVMEHGWEKTKEEYIENEVKFRREIKRVLEPNGVMVVIIGETYRDGYQGICRRLETALEDDGWRIVDSATWVKSNPNPHPIHDHFIPGSEKIIVCCKSMDETPVFHKVTKAAADGKVGLKKSKKSKDFTQNYYYSNGRSCITNVFNTPVCNKSHFKKIDPNYTHPAPAPMEIYEPFIRAYTDPGSTVLDIFCGSGQGLEVGLRSGCNVIGYDINPVNINFCQKRLDMVLDERRESDLQMAA